MGALNPFAKNNGKPAPDPAATAQAQAEANRLTIIGPDGTTNQEFGYVDPRSGKFIANQKAPDGVSAAMRLGESAAERQARIARENIGNTMLSRGGDLSRALMSAPTSLTENLYPMPVNGFGMPQLKPGATGTGAPPTRGFYGQDDGGDRTGMMDRFMQGANQTFREQKGLGYAPQSGAQAPQPQQGGYGGAAQAVDPQAVMQALYDQNMSFARPDMEIARRRAETSLADRGLPIDGEAYRTAMDDVGRQEARTLSQIANQAVLSGANQHQQNFGNALTLRGTQLGERELEQNQLLNQISAMLGGSPQFNRQTVAPSPIDIAGNTYASYNAGEQARQAGMANQQAGLGSMFSLGGMLGAAAISDRRLKANVTRIGTLSNGLNWYEFAYVWAPDEMRQGVMAQEAAEIAPEAVVIMDGGYMAVDYSRIGL